MGDLSKHFSKREFACHCGCGYSTVSPLLIDELELLREELGAPVRVVSGCRCAEHNRKVGGALHSQHVKGKAVDIIVAGYTPAQVFTHLCMVYQHGYGVGLYRSWVHFDVRAGNAARWKG